MRYRVANFARGDGMWWPMSDTRNVQHHLPTQDIAAGLAYSNENAAASGAHHLRLPGRLLRQHQAAGVATLS